MSDGRLTTHVLDTASGSPAVGLRLRLSRLLADEAPRKLGVWRTNAGGRTDAPLLARDAVEPAEYELLFEVAEWRQTAGFYDVVPIRFRIGDPGAHYHVPLILAPFGYSTYRGG